MKCRNCSNPDETGEGLCMECHDNFYYGDCSSCGDHFYKGKMGMGELCEPCFLRENPPDPTDPTMDALDADIEIKNYNDGLYD